MTQAYCYLAAGVHASVSSKKVDSDPYLLAFMLLFFAYVGVSLWQALASGEVAKKLREDSQEKEGNVQD
jgi:hypothetical protein